MKRLADTAGAAIGATNPAPHCNPTNRPTSSVFGRSAPLPSLAATECRPRRAFLNRGLPFLPTCHWRTASNARAPRFWGPLAASWHSNKFLDPVTDGAVLPILHLNSYKIANPTVLARIPQGELESLFYGYGYRPITVAGDDPDNVHQQMAAALDECFDQIAAIQRAARLDSGPGRPLWPMIILRTPKGWRPTRGGR